MVIKYFFNIKNLLYGICLFAGSIITAAQYPVGGLFKRNPRHYFTDDTFIEEPITKFHPDDWNNTGACNDGIKFLKDAQGNKFVIKHHGQKTTMIHDVLGAKILGSVDIPVNKVWPLNRNCRLIKKLPPSLASLIIPSGNLATLHTYLPGKDLPENIDIQRGISTKANLISITASKNLCDIVAGNI